MFDLDCYLVVRNWSVTLTCRRAISALIENVFMAQKGKTISNVEINYFKSDWEASRQFISGESLLSEKDQSSKLKKYWSNRMT